MPSFNNINFITQDGQHFLTAINGGGIGAIPFNGLAANVPAPPGANETFQFLPQNASTGSFALKTADGIHFVTAANGGGIGNASVQFPNRDPGNTFPLHTDAVNASAWEEFTLHINSSTSPWTAQIQASNGDYLSAVGGGGIGDGGRNDTPIHTDATQIGQDEIWSINQVLLYNWVTFEFYTTDDDLSGGVTGRGASWLGASFELADGTGPMNLDPINLNAFGAAISFPSPSVNTCWVQLPSAVTSDYFTQMTLTLFQPANSWPAGTDEWHFGGLRVALAQNGPPPSYVSNPPVNFQFGLIALGNYSGDPLVGYTNTVLSAASPSEVYNIPDVNRGAV